MSKKMSKNKTIRTVEIVDAEIADLTEKRREINSQLTALRAEKKAAEAAAARARAEAVGARILAAAGDTDTLMAIVAEVTEAADEAAPPASGDGDEQPVEHRHEQHGWGGDHG